MDRWERLQSLLTERLWGWIKTLPRRLKMVVYILRGRPFLFVVSAKKGVESMVFIQSFYAKDPVRVGVYSTIVAKSVIDEAMRVVPFDEALSSIKGDDANQEEATTIIKESFVGGHSGRN